MPAAPASKASAAAHSPAAASGTRGVTTEKAWLLALLLLCSSLTPGCYLTHVAAGQWRLLSARESIETLLADPGTPARLRAQLELVVRTRAYARALGLEVGGQYTSYVAWPGDRVVTSVVAARPGELEPASFWFPIVGDVPYRGYFDLEKARAEAERLRAGGYDVCSGPVAAYSTLGWFDDPVTAPMLLAGDGRLVETLLHELVHATAFVASQPEFNEGIATFVGEEASVRFYADENGSEAAARRRREVSERRAISEVILELRDAVAALYADEPAGPGRVQARTRLEAAARARLAALPLETYLPERVATGAQLGDACLALAATYTADVPAYTEALARSQGLEAFVERLRLAAEDPDPRASLLGP